MALSRVKTWTAEVLTASDLNTEFNNILTYLNATTGTYGGTFGASDGSVGVPSVYFSGDTDNGLYRIGANNWALTAGGVKIIELSSTNAIIKGTGTNDSAAATFVGEYIEATLAAGAKQALTTGTIFPLTSISLTAGDWDVSGVITYDGGAGTTVTFIISGINTVNNAFITAPSMGRVDAGPQAAGVIASQEEFIVGPHRLSLSGTTTVYLLTRVDFAVSTANAYGLIRARRVR